MKKANYRLNADGTIMEYCIDPFHPNEPYIEIEDDVTIHPGFDRVIDGKYVPDGAAFQRDVERREIRSNKFVRLAKLKSFLANTDYEVIKFVEGEISPEEFEPIKLQRKAWRAEIKRLEDELGAIA